MAGQMGTGNDPILNNRVDLLPTIADIHGGWVGGEEPIQSRYQGMPVLLCELLPFGASLFCFYRCGSSLYSSLYKIKSSSYYER